MERGAHSQISPPVRCGKLCSLFHTPLKSRWVLKCLEHLPPHILSAVCLLSLLCAADGAGLVAAPVSSHRVDVCESCDLLNRYVTRHTHSTSRGHDLVKYFPPSRRFGAPGSPASKVTGYDFIKHPPPPQPPLKQAKWRQTLRQLVSWQQQRAPREDATPKSSSILEHQ